MLRAIIVATTLLGMAAAASAQDVRGAAEPMETADHHARIERPCAAVEGLSLCVQPAGGLRARPHVSDKRRAGQLTRFTRLAGMFMGRVDAADLGPLKVRFNLQLR